MSIMGGKIHIVSCTAQGAKHITGADKERIVNKIEEKAFGVSSYNAGSKVIFRRKQCVVTEADDGVYLLQQENGKGAGTEFIAEARELRAA